jgi:hypothetical protein
MGELLNAHQNVPRMGQSALTPLKPQTVSEDVWNLLVPAQREAVFQIVVHVCHQLMHCHRVDGREKNNE